MPGAMFGKMVGNGGGNRCFFLVKVGEVRIFFGELEVINWTIEGMRMAPPHP